MKTLRPHNLTPNLLSSLRRTTAVVTKVADNTLITLCLLRQRSPAASDVAGLSL